MSGLFGTPPPVPEGANPFLVYGLAVRSVLFPDPSPGFMARLGVMFGLAGYIVVVCFAYLITTWIDHRRRGKPLWIWRRVRRSNGTYIVGSQHILFVVMSAISSLIIIGFINNGRRTLLLNTFNQRAYFWRSLVYIPMFCHAWISSFANLQAAVLSSQRAAQTHVLTPRLANSLYIGGLLGTLCVVIPVDVVSAYSWSDFWAEVLRLRDVLVAGINDFNANGRANSALLAALGPPLEDARHDLHYFEKTQRAVALVYVVAVIAIIAVNIGGLSLLFTLRRQISFNARRFSTDVRSASKTGVSTVGGNDHAHPTSPTRHSFSTDATSPPPAPSHHHFERRESHPPSSRRGSVVPSEHRSSITSFDRRGSVATAGRRDSTDTRRGSMASTANGLMRKVFFSSPDPDLIEEGDEEQEEKKEVVAPTRSELKEASHDQAPNAVALNQQATQLLALKKIEWDLIVFAVAVSALALMFGAVQIWLAVVTSSIYNHWHTVETALFLVPWAYLVGMSIACSFLLYNLLYHLTAPSKTVSSLGVNGRNRGRATSSGISDELERSAAGPSTTANGHGQGQGIGIGISRIDEADEQVPEHPPITFANSFARSSRSGRSE